MSHRPSNAPKTGGFTLIEVLITILVMAFGLLGFALLQTMSVRFAQSANYRTQMTNLTYELIDQMRANRIVMTTYLGNYTASTDSDDCVPSTGANVTSSDFRDAWECRLGKALGDGATASAVRVGDEITVSITWGDNRWDPDATDQTFSASTQL